MKPFDLQEALNGAPVKLNNGRKAFVLYDLRKYPFLLKATGRLPINGIILGNNDHITWDEFGKAENSYLSIIGIWEDPELTPEQVLEKAYQENLPVNALGKEVFVIAKTKNGDYVIQEDRYIIYIADLRYKWEFYKDPAPKSDTITVTLPKPFKPKEGDVYFCLDDEEQGFILETTYRKCSDFDRKNAEMGQCFRTESDAKAWLDAMKNALDN